MELCNFANVYSLEPVNGENTLVVNVDELARLFRLQRIENGTKKIRPVGLQDCTMCLEHGVRLSTLTKSQITIMDDVVKQDYLEHKRILSKNDLEEDEDDEDEDEEDDNKESIFEELNIKPMRELLKDPQPECCVDSFDYAHAFGVMMLGKCFIFPLPQMYSTKNFSFFRSIIEIGYRLQLTNEYDAPVPEKIKSLDCTSSAPIIRYLERIHKKFLQNNFKCSNFSILQSGKRSFVRSYLLGHRHHGARMTMVVDNELSPDQISIPKAIFKELELAVPLVIINRAPSINETCIYVCELLHHDTDSCIHVNPFVLDGLHADQDGDDISFSYLKYESSIPSVQMQMAIAELRSVSWNWGYRHNVLYKPRYTMGQQFRHLLYRHHEWFIENSDCYKMISRVYGKENRVKCIDVLMHLGCSVMRNEINDLINLILAFNCKVQDNSLRISDYIKCDDEILDVVRSKSKGSDRHIEMYLRNLTRASDEQALKSAFDDKIDSSKVLEQEGQTQFSLLHALSPASLKMTHLYMGDKVAVPNFTKTRLMNTRKYNKEGVFYTIRLMLINSEVFAKFYCKFEPNAGDDLVDRILRVWDVLTKYDFKNNHTEQWQQFKSMICDQLICLFTSKNALLEGIDKVPIGLQYSIMMQSQKIQTALNVKRLKDAKDVVCDNGGTMAPIVPNICIKWLYTPKEYNWYRVILDDISNVNEVYASLINCAGYAILYKNVVEFYFKAVSVSSIVPQMTMLHANQHIVCIVFASNCRGIMELYLKKQIGVPEAMDNLTNFLYCYYTNSLCVDNSKPEHILLYNFVSVMFLMNRNLNNPTKSMTIPPLHAISGEFPQRVLSNLVKNRSDPQVFPITTNREKRMFDEFCDVFAGTSSNLFVTLYDGENVKNKRRKLNV